jgi:rod shape-determining protein MreC
VESLLNRYRNITVLLLVIMAQLVLLAVSAKNDQDVRFVRIWTVTAVTPIARIIEGLRGGSTGFLHNYILLHDTHQENQRLRAELDRIKMENVFLKNELNTADRAKALQVFQAHTPSKTVAATIIATGAGSNSKVVFVDRGTASGIQRGMAVVTPDGIVGKVIAAYPTASQVLLITDSDFAAGVVTEKTQVHGTLKGQGTPQCKVDYIPFEEKVEVGEWLYTSGDDRIFPRGFRVGIVKAVRPGQPFKEVLVDPSGMQHGLEDVLILTEGVHQRIPEAPSGMQPVYIAPAPPGSESAAPADAAVPATLGTEADRLRTQYKALGEEQNHKYGDNPPGTKPVDFTKLGTQGAPAAQAPAPVKNPASPAGTSPRAGTPPSTPGKSAIPPVGAPPIPDARKNTPAPPGAQSATPSVVPPKPDTKNNSPAPTGVPSATPSVVPPKPDAKKNSPTLPAAPAATPVAPPKPPTGGPSGQPVAPPAKKLPPPAGAAAKNPPDAVRRVNQSAGAPPGGQPR